MNILSNSINTMKYINESNITNDKFPIMKIYKFLFVHFLGVINNLLPITFLHILQLKTFFLPKND